MRRATIHDFILIHFMTSHTCLKLMPFIIPAQIMIISGPLKHKVPHCTAAAALAQFNLSCGRHEGWHALLHYSIMLVRLLLQIGGIQVAQLVITATLACEKKNFRATY